MQTLSDPDARAMYDAIAGFSVEAVNPFIDTSFPADQVFVDEVGSFVVLFVPLNDRQEGVSATVVTWRALHRLDCSCRGSWATVNPLFCNSFQPYTVFVYGGAGMCLCLARAFGGLAPAGDAAQQVVTRHNHVSLCAMCRLTALAVASVFAPAQLPSSLRLPSMAGRA